MSNVTALTHVCLTAEKREINTVQWSLVTQAKVTTLQTVLNSIHDISITLCGTQSTLQLPTSLFSSIINIHT